MFSPKVLIVEDHLPFRQCIHSVIQGRADLRIVGEASDGVEGVQRAEELQPDLILLDIGLPRLNGIAAAAQIRELSPHSKILFLSQESSPALVRKALSTGARGYVQKAYAHDELVPAIDAVLKGIRFIGGGLRESMLDTRKAGRPSRHEIQFYSTDAIFCECLAAYVADTLDSGDTALVVTTQAHREDLMGKLKEKGIDVDEAARRGVYIPVDSCDALASFMVDDLPDSARFFECAKEVIGPRVEAARSSGNRVSACGECAPVLWAAGNAEGALQVEHLWDDLVKKYGMDTLCVYSLDLFQDEKSEFVFDKLCAGHSSFSSR